MRSQVTIFIFSCFLFNPFAYLNADAAMSSEKKQKLQTLLERARARKANKFLQNNQVIKEESGFMPADNSRTKDIVHEDPETINLDKSVPKEKEYDQLVDEFDALFSKTQHSKQATEKPKEAATETQEAVIEEVVKTKPKTITKTTAKKPVVYQEPIQEEAPSPEPVIEPEIKIETTKTVSPSPVKTTIIQEPEVKKETVKTKTVKKSTIKKPAKSKPAPVKVIEVKDDIEDIELEEDEFKQKHHHEFDNEEQEEQELDEDEGLVEEKPEPAVKKETQTSSDKPATTKDYLSLVKKSLRSLEEDPWNEVKFNMTETVKYFEKEKARANPAVIEKFHKITLGFLRFAEGGLELDQGDFADFEDAESHYLDSQDILDSVELRLNSNDDIDKELMHIIQTVKKYINEDIEYIEEMINLS